MTELTLEQRIDGVVQTQLGVDADAITPEASLMDDLGADSLDIVELIMRLEQEFGVEIDDDKEWPATVTDVRRLIETKSAAVA